MSRGWHLPAAVLLGIVVRVPFWAEALRTPVDGDTAILGLMAQHLGQGGTTMWGQPYGSPVEAWLLAPFLAILGPTADALRLGYFVLGLGLIPAAYALARALDPRAALPAAVLVACPPPYLLLLSALPPPLYPTSMLLCAALLVVALRAGPRLRKEESLSGTLALWGILSGLAVWTHLMSTTVVVATGTYLVLSCGRRAWGRLGLPLLLLLATSAPWWTRALTDRQATTVLSVSGRRETISAHLAETVPRLHVPLGGLLGTHVPLVADDLDSVILNARPVSAALILVYGIGLIVAVRSVKGAPGAGLLLATALLVVAVFPLPLRSGPATIRFLTPLYLPVAVVVVWAVVVRGGTRRSWVVVLALAVGHLIGGERLVRAWRQADRAAPPFLLPDLRPVLHVLQAHGVRRVYASYGPAYRLTFESREAVIATQPWNERFLHHRLPFLDEVRFAKNVAWVLTPSVPTDLPAPHAFDSNLGAAGGTWRRTVAGAAIVYDGFIPPFAKEVAPAPQAGLAGDGDPLSAIRPDPRYALTLDLGPARVLDGLSLLAGGNGPRLLRSMDVAVSADGTTFEVVATRRRRLERGDLRWVNGHPQYVVDHDLISIPLAGRPVRAVRITPVLSDEPWALGELLLHAKGDQTRRMPWDEWLDPGLTWPERREALTARPQRDREDWYYRRALVERAMEQ
jgi:hypothetical protein